MKRAAVFAAVVLVSALSAAAVRCPVCVKKACPPTPTCRGEVVKDACGCCDTCAKMEGERCGGLGDTAGTCSSGLTCVKKRSTNSWLRTFAMGTCEASCRVGDGASYRGTVSVTATGMTCQRWDSQTPHRHTMTPAKYPSLEQNYCRNPDGESGVWCYTTDPSVRWGYCNVPPCASCRVGDGASYRGTVSVTATGKTCQRWDSQTPHRHTITPAKYPSLEQNYCRNPDGESGVWCYTTDPSVRWGYCNVPPCASCRVGDGASYRGTVSVTATGAACQRWDSQTPHRHTMTPAKYPSLEQNYCRNPDGESGVWCYTTDPSVRWGYCNVPPCEANCPAHSHWSQHGSACRPSCDDPSPRCTKGTRTNVPGCHCETGHVWEGDVCVPLTDCPARSCQQGGKTYQLGETWARQDAPGTTCSCSQNGTVHCEQKKCPHGELIGEDGSWESVAPGVPSCVNTTRSKPVARTDSNLYNVNEK
ncbi:PREDICTED: plasminogen-like [Branchiostoma belcheri]|uniref:Plasminogen-like n=1 Tax=Branchiostoma belcheri TaxID=7741 RepID=A0A6P4XVL9_BRABE|nr:PREDICTED: plasminogen-like [Branchiostoma belcheri]